MELTTRRETMYGGFGHKPTKQYVVYLRGDNVGHGETKEDAQRMAKQTLHDAHTYVTRASVVRVADDGSILVFRMLSDDTAMYEFHRDGKPASGCCMGRMTGGFDRTFRTLDSYADYVVAQYNGVEVAA